ncbi:MAG: hypothetical protein H6712_00220 [Myxococcales bacterium]|nr:hypothetical protein [Myxococcales bacterium]
MASSRVLLVTDLDGRSHPGTGRAWSQLWALLGLLLLVDLMVGLARPEPGEPLLADDLDRARGVLQRARHDEHAWLLLGDSVLAGDVMRGRVPDWSEHRVIDYLRREQTPGQGVAFHQIALDGMLPVDMLHVVEQLDALDPGGTVGVVLEINPRYFSPHYAEQRACTREFLCQLGPPPGPARSAWVGPAADEAWRWLLDHLPVVRHRDVLPRWNPQWIDQLVPATDDAEPDSIDEASAEPGLPEALLGQARILEHYRDPMVGPQSIQYRALYYLLKRLRDHGRPALLFATPLHDAVMAGTLDGDAYGELIGALDRLVNRADRSSVRFLSLDHPVLRDELFLDHAHLGPEGNRWLALNLLHQLGVGMAAPPPRGTLAYEEGPDRSLVHRIDPGAREGAPWQAMLSRPRGIEVAPGGGRVVVADTGNHCVRELVGSLTTMRTLAGQPGTPGRADGPIADALLSWPRFPVLLGERVYVVDGKRHAGLREIAEGQVRTRVPREGPRWTRIDRLRGDGRVLWILDEASRVIRFDPRTGVSRLRYQAHARDLVALDAGPDGRLYLGDRHGRVWQLSPGDDEPVLLFANTAPQLLPQRKGDFFPFRFERMAIETIGDLRYVPRYDGVLVQDMHSVARGSPEGVTERIHLRFLSLADRKIYPWVHPLVHGGGHMFHNRHTKALSSYLHLGTMALDPQTNTLFYLELERSRLLQLSDGLLGTAKLGHHVTRATHGGLKDVFGIRAGTSAMLTHHPERWAHRRLEPLPRRGPYLGLMLGSSLTSVTEVVGQYSMGRQMERTLMRELGLRDGIRFDLVQRAYRGPRLEHLVAAFEAFVEHESPVDVMLLEVHSGRMYWDYPTQGDMVEAVDRLRAAAERYSTLVLVLDDDAMPAIERDGLRGSTPEHQWFLELCERAGFVVLRPSDLLLREAIDHAPWGNAPFTGTHASTWAMDLTADAFARLALPALREHLRGRRPALTRPWAQVSERAEPLRSVFDEAGDEWARAVIDVPAESLRVQLDGSRVEVLVDLGQAGVAEVGENEALDGVVLGAMVQALLRDPTGALGSELTITLARFDNYDEYGLGVLEAARVVDERSYDRDELAAFLEEMAGGE